MMNKKMIAPVVVALLLAAYYIAAAVLLLTVMQGVSIIFKCMMIVVPLVLAGYAIWAMIDRIKEIRSGEEDDLSQY